MKNSFSKWGFSALVLAACIVGFIVTTGAGVCLADDEEQATEQPVLEPRFRDEIDGLQKRADTEAQDVNESIDKEIRKAELRKKNRYREELGYVPKHELLSEDELSVFETERKQKLEALQSRYGGEVNSVQDLGIAAAQESSAGQPDIRTRTNIVYGTVTGIVLYDKKGAALVAGRVVRAGDVIRDIKVIRILPDYIEFEKQGRKWVQEVGQSPAPNVWVEKEKEKPGKK